MTGIQLENLICQLLHKADLDGSAAEIINDSIDDEYQLTRGDVAVKTESLTDANSPHSIMVLEIAGTRFRIVIEG